MKDEAECWTMRKQGSRKRKEIGVAGEDVVRKRGDGVGKEGYVNFM